MADQELRLLTVGQVIVTRQVAGPLEFASYSNGPDWCGVIELLVILDCYH